MPEVNCERCGKTFHTYPCLIKQGRGRFCSLHCFGVSNRNKQLGDDLNPENINEHSPLNKTVCPVSEQKLRELYWKEGMSTAQIADLLSEIFQRKINRASITRWMKIAGIERRSLSHANKLAHKQNPARKESMRDHFKKINIKIDHSKRKEQYCAQMKRANKIRLRLCKERRIAAECSLPDCKNIVSRTPNRYAKYGKRMYCCKSHASKHRAILQKSAKIQAQIQQMQESSRQWAEEILTGRIGGQHE